MYIGWQAVWWLFLHSVIFYTHKIICLYWKRALKKNCRQFAEEVLYRVNQFWILQILKHNIWKELFDMKLFDRQDKIWKVWLDKKLFKTITIIKPFRLNLSAKLQSLNISSCCNDVWQYELIIFRLIRGLDVLRSVIHNSFQTCNTYMNQQIW